MASGGLAGGSLPPAARGFGGSASGAPLSAGATGSGGASDPLAGATVAGVPPYLLRMVLAEAGQWIRSLSDPVRRFHHECRLWGIWGRIAETRRLGAGASRGR